MYKSVKLAAELHLIKNIWRAVEIFPVVVMGGSRDGLRSQERSWRGKRKGGREEKGARERKREAAQKSGVRLNIFALALHRLLACWTSILRAAVLAKSRFDFSAEQNSTLDLPPLKALVAPSSCYGYCKAGGSSGCSPAGCRASVNIIGVDINLYKLLTKCDWMLSGNPPLSINYLFISGLEQGDCV